MSEDPEKPSVLRHVRPAKTLQSAQLASMLCNFKS
jgi:hypothetical protein